MAGLARVALLASCILRGILAAESSQRSQVSPLLQQADAATLQKVAAALSPASSTTLASWNKSNLLCRDWYHVECDPRGFVVSLNLSSSNLNGHVPSIIQNLTHLQTLDLSNNSLVGIVPFAALKSLPQLLHLDLSVYGGSGFGLSGDFSAVAGFSKLQYLALESIVLTGNLSAEIGDMQTLRHLDLDFAASDGSPGEIPLTFRNLTLLQYLSLANLGVSGPIPPIFGGMKQLTHLDLRNNNLGGNLTEVLEELNQISTLQELRIAEVTGPLVPFGQIPANFGASWSHMQIVELNGLNLRGQLPATIGGMQQLLQLNLGFNALTGSLPAAIGNCTLLTNLTLNNNSLSGSLPSTLSKLSQLLALDLSNNHLNESIDGALVQSRDVPENLDHLNFAGNGISVPIPQSWSLFHKLTFLDLHDNNFYGPVPTWLTDLTLLTYLDLSYNQLSGLLPSGWPHTPSSTPLFNDGYFDVSHNYLTGSAELSFGSVSAVPPQSNTTEDHNCFTAHATGQRPAAECKRFCNATVGGGCKNLDEYCHFVNNVPVCFVVPPPPPPPPAPPAAPPPAVGPSPAPSSAPAGPSQVGGKKSSSLGAGPIAAIAAGGVLAILILGLGLAWALRRRAPKDPKSGDYGKPSGGGLEAGGTGPGPRAVTTFVGPDRPGARRFDLAELLLATGGFTAESMIRGGGYGTIYRGVAPDGTKWAVKRTHMISMESLRDFENEVDIISTMSHRNLVKLLGYCQDNQEQILVYEYVPNGNLRQKLNLDPEYGGVPLTFDERLEIALGAARGLHYLHSFANMPIIHRDIKAANLMLDEKLQAKVVDFGLSKALPLGPNGPGEEQHLTTRVAGTPGYLDPDYYRTFQVTTKSDVFSFGVVLCELITGKTAVMKHPDHLDAVALVSWALPYLASGEVAAVADPAMGPYPVEAMNLFTSVALLCTNPVGNNRPTMAQVVRRLEEAQGVTKSLPLCTSKSSSETEWRGVVMPGIPTGSSESSQASSVWAGSER